MPLLGVCLGHQAIGMAVFGGRVVRAPVPMHGKTSMIEHDGQGCLRWLDEPVRGGTLSLARGRRRGSAGDLEVARGPGDDGTVMGLRHRSRPVHGVQFHPESVLTAKGRRMLRNFLERLTMFSAILQKLTRART